MDIEEEIDILAEILEHALTHGCTLCGLLPDNLNQNSFKHHVVLGTKGEIKEITHHCPDCIQA